MPLVNITIEKNKVQNYSFHFSEEKINYLLKFIKAIAVEDEKPEMSLMDEIEAGLNDVKKIRSGEVPRKSLKHILKNHHHHSTKP